MKEKTKNRFSYSIQIPPNATPEEIKKFMEEFKKNWGKDNKGGNKDGKN